jgi:hypothetical protein
MSTDHIEQDHLFWNTDGRTDTYGLETFNYCYNSYQEMVKQQPSPYYHGDWVRAEDYRRDVERLEQLLKDRGIDL